MNLMRRSRKFIVGGGGGGGPRDNFVFFEGESEDYFH